MTTLPDSEIASAIATLDDPTQQARHGDTMTMLQGWLLQAAAGTLTLTGEQPRRIKESIERGPNADQGNAAFVWPIDCQCPFVP